METPPVVVPLTKREELNKLLKEILGSGNVYFQPPESIKMEYPCIVYQLAKMDARYANNKKYARLSRYQVTAMVKNPDDKLLPDIFNMPMCNHVRHFVHDGLNHDVFDLYY